MSDDHQILRQLAGRVAQIACLPEMADRRQMWCEHNLLKSRRPMVLCFPEGAWQEVLPESALMCTDPKLRGWEWALRSKVYWWDHIHDDNFIEPWFDLNWQVHVGSYGFDIPYTFGDERGSYVWDPPMKDLERDFAKLRPRELRVDREATLADLKLAGEIFGDLLPPRIRGMLWWTNGLTQAAAKLIGLENIMWAMYDQPDTLHRLMAFLRDDQMRFIEWCEREQLLSANDGADYVGSGGVGCITEREIGDTPISPVRLADRWGFAESQETVGVSPDMFEEFILPYQVPLLEKSRLNCYGCCEGLEHRIDKIIARVPRLRRVSVAPSANQEMLARKLAARFIYSRKPYPAHICVGFNEQAIRADIRRTLSLVGGTPLELVLKDTHTLEGQPERLGRWVRIAYEEINAHISKGPVLIQGITS